jgi:cytidine deaminase
VHEEELSPQLGRLIDRVKTLAKRAESEEAGGRSFSWEFAAVLGVSGQVYSGESITGVESGGGRCAAEEAVGSADEAGEEEILAIALLAADGRSFSTPCPECRRFLSELNPELATVTLRRGRWVLLPLSALESEC